MRFAPACVYVVYLAYIHAALLKFYTLLKNVDQNDEILFTIQKLKRALSEAIKKDKHGVSRSLTRTLKCQ